MGIVSIRSCTYYKRRIKWLLEEIDRCESNILGYTKIMSGMPAGHQHHDKMAEYVARKEQLVEQLRESVVIAGEEEFRVRDLIDRINNPYQQQILIMKYVHDMTMAQIASSIYVSVRHCKRLHKKALENLSLYVTDSV